MIVLPMIQVHVQKCGFSKCRLVPVSKMQSRYLHAQTQQGYLGHPGDLPGTLNEV